MKILITGAAGFTGKILAEALSKKHTVYALDVKPMKRANIIPLKIDLTDKRQAAKLKKIKFDIVYHLAAVQMFSKPKPMQEDFFDVNVEGTKNILAACKGTKRFVFASSTAVYGRKKGRIEENEKCNPTTPYAKSKLLAERYVKESGIPFTILRFCTIYGPREEGTLNKIISFVKKGRLVPIIAPQNRLHLVHITDVISALEKSLSPKAKNKTYNIAGPDTPTVREMIGMIENEIGSKKTKINVPEQVARHLIKIYEKMSKHPLITSAQAEILFADQSFDISRARKAFGYNPQTNTAEGIKKIVKIS